jgi:prepilin-type N-terminal cleavage/methylation domain-containing protein
MKQRGFTLIELAIVLVIITILVGGLAVPLSAQIKARRVAETRQTLEEARNAIIGYAMTHQTSSSPPRPYLPCPDNDGDGIEDRTVTGGCASASGIGWFPWVTLGTAAQDAWGNRLLYASHSALTNSQTGFSSATTPTADWNQVCSSHTCATGDLALNVPVVLVSFGPNGWGARNVSGADLAAPSGADEQENQDGDKFFVSRMPSNPGDASGEFDDLAVWLSIYDINSRVCPSGGCP